jgi:hypothetical protein
VSRTTTGGCHSAQPRRTPPKKTKPQLDIDFNEQLDKDDVVHFMNLRSAAQHIEAMHGREYLATLSTEELLSHAQVAAPAEAPAS